MVAVVGLCIGVISLIMSAMSLISNRRMAERQSRLQERLIALESGRDQERQRQSRLANLRAAIERTTEGWYLSVLNEGPASARNVAVQLDGVPLARHALFFTGQSEITKLGPRAYARYPLAVALQSQQTVDARITWDDDSSEPRSWESQLTL
jgi:hypothetical protein